MDWIFILLLVAVFFRITNGRFTAQIVASNTVLARRAALTCQLIESLAWACLATYVLRSGVLLGIMS